LLHMEDLKRLAVELHNALLRIGNDPRWRQIC